MTIKTIFLDRDGVINKDIGYLYKIADCEFIDGIFDACTYFQSLGYKIIIITNQSGISKGFYNHNDFMDLTSWMVSHFAKHNINILDVFHCPHSPKSYCSCRKPKPGMLIEARNKYNIDMAQSWMIGDKEIDSDAAISAGISKTILVRSGQIINENISKAKFILDSIKDTKLIITS